MTKDNLIIDSLCEDAMIVDGYDDCIIGKEYTTGRAVYSIGKILDQMITLDSLSFQDAIDHFDHNIGCAYYGDMTPIFIWDDSAE